MRYRCYKCKSFAQGGRIFEANEGEACPQCGAAGVLDLRPLDDVHFLAPAPDGPIYSLGKRYAVACDTKRDGLALFPGDAYSATGDAQHVTCRSCLTTPAYRQAAQAFRGLAERLAGVHGVTILPGGCC